MLMRYSVFSLLLLVGLLGAMSARAGMTPEEEADYERQVAVQKTKAIANIPRLVRTYGETIGCDFYMQGSNVAPYDLDEKGEYVALFVIDEGCSGGNAMFRPVLALLRWGAGNKLYIDVNRSTPRAADALPQGTSKLFVRGDELRFSGVASWWDHQRVAGRLSWSDGASGWRVASP